MLFGYDRHRHKDYSKIQKHLAKQQAKRNREMTEASRNPYNDGPTFLSIAELNALSDQQARD